MSKINTQLKKLKLIVFPPTKYPCSIHPDTYCRNDQLINTCRDAEVTQPRRSSIEKDSQEQKTEKSRPSTSIEPSGHGGGRVLSAEHNNNPIYNDHHDKKRGIKSAFKRCMLPFKIHYELEWDFPDDSKTHWLQLDAHTANGIERVRKLGVADLDVPLNYGLARYIYSKMGQSVVQDIVVQVVFDPNSYGDDEDATRRVRLSRLRRVHWWSTSYNVARTSA